ncbi:hypothetical protein SteCoe_6905 [Stentor coeruleus]|uniref:Uncharacterized protein n=1 Tax=Stentor coeruleus TaxID=5963 RepID=A0A1R2CNP4_9CILI|nr:hypothetical protein SteCoe_6905 [Stentor coeruleus]
MEEDIVKTKVPEVYQSIIKTEEEFDWEQLKEDFEELNWLDFESLQASDTIISVWKVADKYGVSVLQSAPRFKIFKLTKVKMVITNYMLNIIDSPEISLICKESRGKIEDMLFFSCAKGMMFQSSEECLPNLALRIYDIYTEFKTMISQFFIHFDKLLKSYINMTISSLLDEIFYNKVLKEFRGKLINEESTKKMITDLGGKITSYEIGTSYTDDFINYKNVNSVGVGNSGYDAVGNTGSIGKGSSGFSSYSYQNLYVGELNEENKRHGYGKITYFGGDTYEGYWDNDKPHGEGLYLWKIGGRYLGSFVKGNISGQGKRIYPSGNFYTGEFLNNKKHGKGEIIFKNGDTYEGTWEDDYMNGHGKYTWSTGDHFVGIFIKDIREGKGILTTINGDIIEGAWKDNQYIGN